MKRSELKQIIREVIEESRLYLEGKVWDVKELKNTLKPIQTYGGFEEDGYYVFQFADNFRREQFIKKIKDLGIKPKEFVKKTLDKGFDNRYLLKFEIK
jgi:hypothetical protein